MAIAFVYILERNGHSLWGGWTLSLVTAKGYARELYAYSHPLFVYALFVMVAAILDRWMLQTFSGSTEQGFFGLSYQIAVVCMLFSSSLAPLLGREFTIAHERGDLREMGRLFRRYIPAVFALAAYLACFIAVEAERIAVMFGGEQFREAGPAVAVMAFLPVHGAYGQLSGSVFYATGQTGLYRNIGMVCTLGGLVLAYFLLAPGHMAGWHGGAVGLALKLILINIVRTNVQLWFNARLLALRFWRYVAHQIVSTGCLLGGAAISVYAVDTVVNPQTHGEVGLVLAGVIYTIGTMLLCYFRPQVFGLQGQDIRDVLQRLQRVRHISAD
jgi:O-antigen/teichoic acid export membrane protein